MQIKHRNCLLVKHQNRLPVKHRNRACQDDECVPTLLGTGVRWLSWRGTCGLVHFPAHNLSTTGRRILAAVSANLLNAGKGVISIGKLFRFC